MFSFERTCGLLALFGYSCLLMSIGGVTNSFSRMMAIVMLAFYLFQYRKTRTLTGLLACIVLAVVIRKTLWFSISLPYHLGWILFFSMKKTVGVIPIFSISLSNFTREQIYKTLRNLSFRIPEREVKELVYHVVIQNQKGIVKQELQSHIKLMLGYLQHQAYLIVWLVIVLHEPEFYDMFDNYLNGDHLDTSTKQEDDQVLPISENNRKTKEVKRKEINTTLLLRCLLLLGLSIEGCIQFYTNTLFYFVPKNIFPIFIFN